MLNIHCIGDIANIFFNICDLIFLSLKYPIMLLNDDLSDTQYDSTSDISEGTFLYMYMVI